MDTVIDMTNLAVVREVLNYDLLAQFISFLFVVGVVVALFWFFKCAVYPKLRPTQHYRKVLMDLFVVGKIKKFAEDDNIKLAEEEVDFNKWSKKQKLTDVDLDIVIEEEMKEKISEESLKKLKKETKEAGGKSKTK